MKKIPFLLLGLLTIICACGQQNHKVSGVFRADKVDANYDFGLWGGRFIATNAKGVIVADTKVDIQGNFTVEVPKGKYLVNVGSYESDSRFFEIEVTGDTVLDTIKLTKIAATPQRDLREITSRMNAKGGQKNYRERETENITYNFVCEPIDYPISIIQLLDRGAIGGLVIDGEQSAATFVINDKVIKHKGTKLVEYLKKVDARNVAKVEIVSSAKSKELGGEVRITSK